MQNNSAVVKANAKDSEFTRGILNITQQATAKVKKATENYPKGKYIARVEIIGEFILKDKQKRYRRPQIDTNKVIGTLTIGNASEIFYLSLLQFTISANMKLITYRAMVLHNMSEHNSMERVGKVSGILKFKRAVNFEKDGEVQNALVKNQKNPMLKINIRKTNFYTIKSTAVGKISIDILLHPSEIKGKSFTIKVGGEEQFTVYATNPKAIQLLIDNYNNKNNNIVTGMLVIGDGGFNSPWSWHLDPDTVDMAEITMELCDGRPSDIENNLAYWILQVKRYCPWSTRVIKIND
jgi:hypothetical protein